MTGGLEWECWGEERATGGTPLAGLVPGPLPPANLQEERTCSEQGRRDQKPKRNFRENMRTESYAASWAFEEST